MSFVINTTIDKNKEFLDALRDSFNHDLEKDVYLICKNVKIPINSYALGEYLINLNKTLEQKSHLSLKGS